MTENVQTNDTKKTAMKHVVTLVVGDWSHDGHGMSESVMIRSSLNTKGLEKAYQAGTKIVGFDFCEDVACDYEDSRIGIEDLRKLRIAGFAQGLDDERNEEEGKKLDEEFMTKYQKKTNFAGACLDGDSYVDIYLFIVKLGEPTFSFKRVKGQRLTLGGYGLFSH